MSKPILSKIHKRVLKNFKYVTDKRQYDTIEKWVEPEDVDNVTGDCEDFAFACRKLIREEGLPSRLIYCKDETGEGHLVLESGGWVLDNRQKSLKTKQKLERIGYEFISISGFQSGDNWYKL